MAAGVESVVALSRRWRVARKTADKWLERYQREGLVGLKDPSRKPDRSAPRRGEEQRRSNRWLRQDREPRAREALGLAVPATRYRQSRRRMPAVIKPWRHPKGWGGAAG